MNLICRWGYRRGELLIACLHKLITGDFFFLLAASVRIINVAIATGHYGNTAGHGCGNELVKFVYQTIISHVHIFQDESQQEIGWSDLHVWWREEWLKIDWKIYSKNEVDSILIGNPRMMKRERQKERRGKTGWLKLLLWTNFSTCYSFFRVTKKTETFTGKKILQ